MCRGVKSHVALMQRHLKRFIDHFIDLISCRGAKIKLDTAMTFAATLPMNRVVRLQVQVLPPTFHCVLKLDLYDQSNLAFSQNMHLEITQCHHHTEDLLYIM